MMFRISPEGTNKYGYELEERGTKATGSGFNSFSEAFASVQKIIKSIRAGTEMDFGPRKVS